MTDQFEESLRLVAGLLAALVAGMHLYWGIPRFTLYATIGTMPDPRPFAFILSGHVILIGITLVAAGLLQAERLYLPGIVLMVVHLVGYFAWHTVLTHGVDTDGHTHTGLGALIADLATHLIHSPLPLAAALSEIAVIVVLGLLIRRYEHI